MVQTGLPGGSALFHFSAAPEIFNNNSLLDLLLYFS